MTEGDNDRLRLQELAALEEKRFKLNITSSYIKLESRRPSTKRLKRESFNLVIAVRRPMVKTHKTNGKFQPKWEGHFVVEIIYSNRAYRLANSNGDTLKILENVLSMITFYTSDQISIIHDHVNVIPLVIKSDSSDYSISSWNFIHSPRESYLSRLSNNGESISSKVELHSLQHGT